MVNKLRQINPPTELEGVILGKIQEKEKRNAFVQCVVGGIFAIGSCIGTISAFLYMGKSIGTSGFYEYVSLLFSDSGSLLSYWKEFSMSLAESLPLFGLTIALILIGIFIWSLSKTTKNVKVVLALS